MISSVHNSIHLTEMVTILLRRCVCPSGRIFKIWTHTIFSPYSMHLSKGISISATAATTINRVIPHMQPSHPMESIRHVHIQLYITYRMTSTVFSWGTPQQQQQFLMTTYMTSLCSHHSTQRPPDGSLSAWQMCTPHGCAERD